jgi:acetyl-CoA synthetase
MYYSQLCCFFLLQDQHIDVAESAVVSFPHSIKGEGVCAFVTLKQQKHESKSELINELKMNVRKGIAAYAVPEWILVCVWCILFF